MGLYDIFDIIPIYILLTQFSSLVHTWRGNFSIQTDPEIRYLVTGTSHDAMICCNQLKLLVTRLMSVNIPLYLCCTGVFDRTMITEGSVYINIRSQSSSHRRKQLLLRIEVLSSNPNARKKRSPE